MQLLEVVVVHSQPLISPLNIIVATSKLGVGSYLDRSAAANSPKTLVHARGQVVQVGGCPPGGQVVYVPCHRNLPRVSKSSFTGN